MASIPGIRRFFRLPASEGRASRDVSDEIEFHLSMRIEALVARGASPASARAQAEREFGDAAAAQEELTEMSRRRARSYRRAELHEWLWRDLRYAFRSLTHDRLFTAGVMLTLALGIGVNAAMFGMTDRVLLQPPAHVVDPDRVARVYFQKLAPWGEMSAQVGLTYTELTQLRSQSRTLDIAAYTPTPVVAGRGPDAEEITGVAATAAYLPLLGAKPLAGRFFTAEEDTPKRAARVVVLGHGYWQRRFGGSYAVLGRSIELERESYTVIGIAPPRFTGIDLMPVDVFVPASAWAETYGIEDWHETRGFSWIMPVARLRPGASADAAVAELTRLHDGINAAHGAQRYGDSEDERAGLGPVITARGPDFMRGAQDKTARVTLLLLGVSLVVLLVACANVTNLLLARSIRRTRELAIRVALGVGHGRLLSLVVGEALLLSLGGGIAGLLLAWWAGRLLPPVLLPDVDWSGSVVSGRVLGFSALLVLGCTLLVAIVPALQALRTEIGAVLRSGVREGGGRRAGMRRALVVAQAALSLTLLAGAGLFVRSLQRAASVDFGFDGRQVLVMTWNQRSGERTDSAWLQLYQQAAERVRALPGVEAVSLGALVPGRSGMSHGGLITGEGDSIPQLAGGGPYSNAVDTAFFHTLGIALRRGRTFNAQDRAGAPRVIVVDEAFADAVWPGQDPVGRCVRLTRAPTAPAADRECMEVVGVVETTRESVDAEPSPQFFHPLDQTVLPSRGLFVRARTADGVRLVASVREAVQRTAPDLPYADVRTLQSHFDAQLAPWRVGVTLFVAFGLLALLVAGIGLYSVLAYSVVLRERELGVRQALGARTGELIGLVLRDAGRVLAGGLALGLALVLALSGTVRSLLFRVEPHDPLVLAGVSVLLLGTGLVAALAPARRAARVAPASVLRAE